MAPRSAGITSKSVASSCHCRASMSRMEPMAGADFEKSGKSARETDGWGQSRQRFGLQVGEIVGLELLGGDTEGGVLVELDGAAFGGLWRLREERGRRNHRSRSGRRRRERVRR